MIMNIISKFLIFPSELSTKVEEILQWNKNKLKLPIRLSKKKLELFLFYEFSTPMKLFIL